MAFWLWGFPCYAGSFCYLFRQFMYILGKLKRKNKQLQKLLWVHFDKIDFKTFDFILLFNVSFYGSISRKLHFFFTYFGNKIMSCARNNIWYALLISRACLNRKSQEYLRIYIYNRSIVFIIKSLSSFIGNNWYICFYHCKFSVVHHSYERERNTTQWGKSVSSYNLCILYKYLMSLGFFSSFSNISSIWIGLIDCQLKEIYIFMLIGLYPIGQRHVFFAQTEFQIR